MLENKAKDSFAGQSQSQNKEHRQLASRFLEAKTVASRTPSLSEVAEGLMYKRTIAFCAS